MALFLTTLKKEIFSKKSLFVGAFFLISSYLIGRHSSSVSSLLDGELTNSLFVLYALLGYLFSSVLFSGLLAGEIESQTMRFLVPYLSRRSIYLFKYLASTSYFLVLTFVSLIILFITKGAVNIPFYSLLAILGFYLYIQSLVMLVSVSAGSERLSNLINLMLSILFPILYTASLLKSWPILEPFRWLFPYHYLSKTWEIIILYFLSAVLVFAGQLIFEKREI